jgi:hypothetical protein
MTTVAQMLHDVKTKGRPLASFHKGDTIEVNNKMKKGYRYVLQEEPGTNFSPEFKPFLDPGEILAHGAFEGKYLNDCIQEFPAEWYLRALALGKLSPQKPDVSLNLFQIKSRLSLKEWEENGWVPPYYGKRRHHDSMGRDILNDPVKNPDERGRGSRKSVSHVKRHRGRVSLSSFANGVRSCCAISGFNKPSSR